MTNSEAIETLKANYPDPCFGLLREAVDVAINALSAHPDPIRLNIDHALTEEEIKNLKQKIADSPIVLMPSAQPDYTELKREFILMASYIDVLLECSDEQKETLIGFISRLSEYMPWTERD